MAFRKIYIVLCPSFHGATLLAKLLNSHPDIVALGDTYPSNTFNQICGCGSKVSECSFWQNIKEEIGAYYNPAATAWLPNYPWGPASTRKMKMLGYAIRLLLNKNTAKRWFDNEELAQFASSYSAFLEAVERQPSSQGSIFVDGVKSVMRLSCLLAGGIKVDGIIHLVRNPTDFVASCLRNYESSGPLSVVRHSIEYRAYHAKVHKLSKNLRTCRIDYEEMVSDLDENLRKIFLFIGVEPMGLKELREHIDQEWHFIGNQSLLKFDGTFRVSRHHVPSWQRHLTRLIAGSRTIDRQ